MRMISERTPLSRGGGVGVQCLDSFDLTEQEEVPHFSTLERRIRVWILKWRAVLCMCSQSIWWFIWIFLGELGDKATCQEWSWHRPEKKERSVKNSHSMEGEQYKWIKMMRVWRESEINPGNCNILYLKEAGKKPQNGEDSKYLWQKIEEQELKALGARKWRVSNTGEIFS